MSLYGLIGYPLSHSWSDKWFNKRFRAEVPVIDEYRLFPIIDIASVRRLVEDNPGLAGLNVTIPYKVKVIPYLDDLDKIAAAIGAVNTISITREGNRIRMKGYNTDAEGFIESTDFSGYSDALIIGTGGAARAVSYILNQRGINTLFVSRDPVPVQSVGYSEITPGILAIYTLIINATPLGMNPDTGSFPPIPYELLDHRHFLYDLVYNPEMTAFLEKGKKAGSKIMNGLKMLQLQAEKTYEIWKGIS